MRIAILLFICLLMPTAVFAEKKKVAVLPVSYWLVWKNAESVEKAKAIQEDVVHGIEDAGFEALRGPGVEEAVWAASGSEASNCRDKACLASVTEKLGVDNAIFISITEEGLLYNVEIILADGEPEAGPLGGNFSKLKTGVRSMVKSSVSLSTPSAKKPEDTSHRTPDKPEENPQDSEGGAAGPGPVPARIETDFSSEKRKGLRPLFFYGTAGLTSAFAIGWVIVESVGYARMPEIEQGTWDRKNASSVQSASRALLSFAGAGAVATAALFFFTNFAGDERPSGDAIQARTIVPAVTEHGGILTIRGEF